MTDNFPYGRLVSKGLLALSGSILLLVVAALSIAPVQDVETCPTLLATAMVIATGLISPLFAVVYLRTAFEIYTRAPVKGIVYTLLIALIGTIVAILFVSYYFDLTKWWAHEIAPLTAHAFRRECF